MEVASPGSGILREILKQEQEEIAPGELLGRIEPRASACRDSKSAASTVVATNVAAVAATGRSATAAPSAAAGSLAGPGGRAAGAASGALSPAVRRLLAERALDPSQVTGTGQDGRITVEDVLGHAKHGAAAELARPPAPAAPLASALPRDRAPLPVCRRRGPRGVGHRRHSQPPSAAHGDPKTHRRAHGPKPAPHRPSCDDGFRSRPDCGVGAPAAEQRRLRTQGAPLTLTAYFLQATVAAIRAVPEANSRWTDSALEVFDSMHIGVATALETGLVVPVLRDVQSLDLFGSAQGFWTNLCPELVTDIYRPQMFVAAPSPSPITASAAASLQRPIIINQPQSAILGVGKLEKRPVVMLPTKAKIASSFVHDAM